MSLCVIASLPLIGCAGKREPQSRARLKEQAREIVKQNVQTATVRVTGGQFQAADNQGRLVLVARIKDADAILQPSDPSQGPVTLTKADLTLYKEGKPSLWLKAPVATWKAGLLTAPRGADSGSVDGKITLHGKKQATWTAKTDRLSVTTAECEVREPGRPALLAQGPAATWQDGLLTLPSGGIAHAIDGSASMRADRVRWRAKSHGLEAVGRVRMTRGRLAGAAERLTGDTTLRQFRLTGGRPRVTFYHQPPPLVVAAVDDRGPAGMLFPSRRGSTAIAQAFMPGKAKVRFARQSGGVSGQILALLPRAEPRVYRKQTPLKRAAERAADLAPDSSGLLRLEGTAGAPRIGTERRVRWAAFTGSVVPTGLGTRLRPVPSDESLGYCRPSLRDEARSDLAARPLMRRSAMARSRTRPLLRRSAMARSRTWPLLSAAGHVALLAALPMPAAHAARSQATLSSGTTVEADEIRGSPSGGVHAIGKVVVTGTQSTLSADRVDATPSKGPAGSSRSSVQEARASGHVRLTSQPKPDERMEATGTAGTYWPGTQKATLTGGVTVTMTSPQLQEPAVLTGARADIDLAQRAAEVSRTEAAQVALRLHPKADASSSGSAAAGPVRLDADRIRMENAANRITATGSPVLTGDQGTVRAEKIWFDVDPKANDIKMVHAAGSVRIDSQDAQGGTFHGKSDEAVMNRADDTVVLTGNVHGTHTRPDEPEPETLSTDVLTYNHKTGEWSMRSSSEARSRVTFKPKPKPAGAGGDGATGRSSRGRRGK